MLKDLMFRTALCLELMSNYFNCKVWCDVGGMFYFGLSKSISAVRRVVTKVRNQQRISDSQGDSWATLLDSSCEMNGRSFSSNIFLGIPMFTWSEVKIRIKLFHFEFCRIVIYFVFLNDEYL